MATKTIRPNPVVYSVGFGQPVDSMIVREKIVLVLHNRLARIQIANGYSCDCGTEVNEGKIIDITPPTPSLNFWDGDETAEKLNDVEMNNMTLTVELYEKGTSASTSTTISRIARRMSADARKAILMNDDYSRPDPTLDGLARGLTYKASDLVLGFGPESWTGVILEFEVVYETLYGNLYRSHR